MSGLKRNMYYWGSILHKQMFGILAYVIVFVFFIALSGGGDLKTEIMNIVPTYIVMLIILVPFLNAISGSSTLLPVSISFGTTRKASYTAMQMIQHIIMLEFLIIAAAVYYWGEPETLEIALNYLFVLIGAICMIIALGNIISIINFKCGKTAGIIAYLIIVFGMVIGIIGLMALEDASAIEKILIFFVDKQYLGLVGVAFDLVTVYGFYKAIQKSNLQF